MYRIVVLNCYDMALQCLVNRSYVSNCGIELLRHGFTMFTKCGDLRTSQYSEIFQVKS